MPAPSIKLFLAPPGVLAPPGWLPVEPGELTNLHFASGAVQAAYIQDWPSLMPEKELVLLLQELKRVIQPGSWRDEDGGTHVFEGGIIRIATPDVATATRAYAESDMGFFRLTLGAAGDRIGPGEGLALWLSRYAPVRAYDHGALMASLRRAGISATYRSARHKSLLPWLRGTEFDGEGEHRLYFECWPESENQKQVA